MASLIEHVSRAGLHRGTFTGETADRVRGDRLDRAGAGAATLGTSADRRATAETRQAKLLSETGLPNRFYIPPEHVRTELLEPSATHTVCPYKGTASYRGLRVGQGVISDAAWFYPTPHDGARRIAGHLCFLSDHVETFVDGQPV